MKCFILFKKQLAWKKDTVDTHVDETCQIAFSFKLKEKNPPKNNKKQETRFPLQRTATLFFKTLKKQKKNKTKQNKMTHPELWTSE